MGYWELRANIGVLRQNSGHNKWRQYLFPTMISFSIAKTQSSTLLSSPSPTDPICAVIASFFARELQPEVMSVTHPHGFQELSVASLCSFPFSATWII